MANKKAYKGELLVNSIIYQVQQQIIARGCPHGECAPIPAAYPHNLMRDILYARIHDIHWDNQGEWPAMHNTLWDIWFYQGHQRFWRSQNVRLTIGENVLFSMMRQYYLDGDARAPLFADLYDTYCDWISCPLRSGNLSDLCDDTAYDEWYKTWQCHILGLSPDIPLQIIPDAIQDASQPIQAKIARMRPQRSKRPERPTDRRYWIKHVMD